MPELMAPGAEEMFAQAVQRARLGEEDEARKICQELLDESPGHVSGQALLALLLGESGDLMVQGRLCLALGRPEQSVAILRQALSLEPNQAHVVALLGTGHRLQGQSAEAERFYRAALDLDPDQPHAQVGQAIVWWQTGDSRRALERLRAIVEKTPENVDAQMALGDLLYDRGDYIGSTRQLGRLLDSHPYLLPSRQSLARCLSRKPLAVLALENEKHLEESLAHPDLEVEMLSQATVVLLLRRPSLQPLWDLEQDLEEGGSSQLETILDDSLLAQAIAVGVMSDLTIERGLTARRRAVLKRLVEKPQPDEPSIRMAEALALNGWYSEFVFAVSGEEQQILAALEPRDDLGAALGQAMYGPLTRPRKGLERLVRTHVTEPATERALAATIPSLTTVDQAVSSAVSQMYEENPYPRWRSLSRTTRMRVGHGLQAFFPSWKAPPGLEQPRLLVAGCGTGRDLLTLASSWETSEVVGLDLSRASLAHARRMADQLGMSQVKLYQADLLALHDWDQRFDVIACTGVLHHLEDPVAGWQVLTGLLKPGGIMKIALYSERARQGFVAAQRWVAERGLSATVDGIRQARQEIAALPRDHPAWSATTVRDFYYSSGCRDLLFHVQEHRFTIRRLAELLPQLGLSLIGFETSGDTRLRYDALFPDDPARTNLVFWEKFEELYPSTFVTMYQFWCQKLPAGDLAAALSTTNDGVS